MIHAKIKKFFCKSQSAIEFISLASFMLLVVLGFLAVTSSNMLQAKEEGNRKTAEDIADFAYREIDIAKSVNNGYIRVFNLPQTVNGVSYDITMTDNRELTVNYLDYEFVRFLPSNVTGNISKGDNRISKKDGIIYIGSIPVQLPPLLLNLILKNNGSTSISFDNNGNVVIKGTLSDDTNPAETAADELIIKNSNGIIVAVLNADTGDMTIKGTLFQNQASPIALNPGSNFIVRDYSGNIVDYIDESGNFYLKGTLTQNGNP